MSKLESLIMFEKRLNYIEEREKRAVTPDEIKKMHGYILFERTGKYKLK